MHPLKKMDVPWTKPISRWMFHDKPISRWIFRELSLTKPSSSRVFPIDGTPNIAPLSPGTEISAAHRAFWLPLSQQSETAKDLGGVPHPLVPFSREKGWKRYGLVMRNRMEIGLKVTFIEDRLRNDIPSCVSGKFITIAMLRIVEQKCQFIYFFFFPKWTGYKLFELFFMAAKHHFHHLAMGSPRDWERFPPPDCAKAAIVSMMVVCQSLHH